MKGAQPNPMLMLAERMWLLNCSLFYVGAKLFSIILLASASAKNGTMSAMFSINRFALLLRPKPAFIAWINQQELSEEPLTYQISPEHDDTDVYLIPEFGELEDAEAWLRESYEDFLTSMLEEWCPDESQWPSPLTWELFDSFLHYSIQSVVVDTLDASYDEDITAEWN